MKKNIITITSAIIALIFVIVACSKEDTSTIEQNIKENKKENTKKRNKVGAGDFIEGDGWLGWLDPDLVGEDEEIPENEIWQGNIKWRGFIMDDGNGIACPEEGDNCGPLKTEGENGLPITVGVYLLEEGKSKNNNNKSLNGVQGGDYIDGDGWLGWLDPENVGEDEEIPLGEIYKEEPKYSGEKTENGIACPDEGDNCGRLYTLDDGGKVYVGFYLVEE